MTQPVSPLFNPAGASPLFPAGTVAQPGATPAPAAQPIDFAPTLNQPRPEIDPEQARLEATHSQGETFGTQFVRGALDALLSPGALVGLSAETAGAAFTGAARSLVPEEYRRHVNPGRILEDFGRDFGRASTGRSALEATGALLGAAGVFGEQGATDIADTARIAVDEQERAWPLLSTGARIGGGLAFGLATGGIAGGAKTGAGGLAAIGAVEGSGAGAQAAYDVDAPLTEVWTSALMGGTLGAGLGAAPGAIGAGVSKLRGSQKLAGVFGGESEALGKFGENRIASSLGFTKQHYKKYGTEKIAQVARAVDDAHLADGTPVFPKNVIDAAKMDRAEIAGNLAQAHDELGKEIGALRARASQWIDESMPVLRPSPRDIAARIRSEVAEPLLKSASEAERSAGRYVAKTADNLDELGESMPLEQFVQQRSALGDETNFTAATPKPQTLAMRKVYGMINDDLAARFERAADGMGETSLYRPLNQKYHLYEVALEGLDNGLAMQQGNNMLGLSSNIVMAGTFAGDIATGGGFSALKALGAGIGHKLIMEKGPQVLAALARKFARTHVAVDVATAGGKEAQDAMTQLLRAKKLIQETADEAGPNANVRAVAENTAQEAATQQLIKLAGGFDRANWAQASRAPSPLARVLYRTQILDAVSQDLAPTVGRTASMRPALDFELDSGKLGRLARDAEATDAIAAVQAKVREIADAGTGPVGQRPGEVARAARDIPTEEIPYEAYFGRESYRPERVDLDRVRQVGLQGSEYIREGMRDASFDAIRQIEDLRSLGPARISIDPDGNVALIDGRHRMTVAQERGEQTFLTKVIQLNGEGDAVGTIVTEIPIRPQGQLARPAEMEAALEALNTADAGEAMAIGHRVARQLMREGKEADARALQLTLGDDLFGQAGKAYRQMTAPPSETLGELADPTKLREALRTLELRGQLSQQIAEEHRAALAAFDARKRLTGEAVPTEVREEMRAIEKMWARGEENVTLDGTRLGRIVDALDNMTESRVASKVPRVPEEQQVAATVQTGLKPVEQTLRRSTGRAIAAAALRSIPRALSQKERIAQYEQRLDTLAQVATQPDTEQQTAAIQEAPAGVREALVTAQSQKVQNLLRDMPKPRTTIQGTAYDSLSSEEIRRGNAMWEATMEPLSVFEDFARGNVDPDKVSYAWRQYPGLQQMAQLGVLDVLQSQMTAEERSRVPGNVLSQLDFMLGFKGGLQSTVSFEFSQRISGIHEQLQQQSATPSPPSKGLSLPTSKPTMTQRIAGAQ